MHKVAGKKIFFGVGRKRIPRIKYFPFLANLSFPFSGDNFGEHKEGGERMGKLFNEEVDILVGGESIHTSLNHLTLLNLHFLARYMYTYIYFVMFNSPNK